MNVLLMNLKTLQEIPSEIDQLKEELTELDLANNPYIKQLPPTVGGLHELHTINFNGCTNLESLPPMSNLTQLKKLNFINCPKLASLSKLECLFPSSDAEKSV